MPKGQENVDKTIDICREIVEALEKIPSIEGVDVEASKEQINNIIAGLQEISGKFFLKSNPSIPPTSACLKSAEELKRALQRSQTGKDHNEFLNAFESFKKAIQSLGKRASMRSTVIT